MAVSIVMTGTGRSCTLTSGSNSISVSSAAGLVVGATIQGTGIPAGTRIRSISITTVVMENGAGGDSNATVSGAQNLIFSSVWGSVLTISMSASGDTANMDTIYNAGFGVKQRGLATREIYFPGALGIEWKNIVAGAVFDFQNWTIECGSGGYWAWEQSTILGELRGGYLVNGTQFIKSSGPTFISNNFKNSAAGGSNMFTGTATGTVTGTFRMNNLRVVYQVGSNTAPFFACGRMNCIVDNMILDYQGGGGPNAGISAAFGALNNTTIVKANSGIGNPNGGQYATINGLSYSGIYTDSPNHKFAIPNGYVLEGYAPQVLSTQTLGAFQGGTTETYANIDLSTAGWGLNDLKEKYFRYGGPNTINFPRRVTFEFNDSTAANLAGVTLFIKSGSTTVVNAVQAGDYDANTQALVLTWTTTTNAYRIRDSFTDTIAQVAQVRKYGYIEQQTSYSLNLAKYSQPFFMLAEPTLAAIDDVAAAAITTAGINWSTKTITPTADLNYDQINARLDYELALTVNSAQANPRTISGSNLTLASGWTLVVNSGITISAGTAITYLKVPTATLNGTGKITGLYGTSAGDSSTLRLQGVSATGVLGVWHPSTSATELFQTNNNGSTSAYEIYYPPGSVGLVKNYARELYGSQRVSGSITLAAGLNTISFVDIPDVGIAQPTLATVQAYSAIENPDKFYDSTAAFRLTEQGIKLGQMVTREGTALNIGNFSHVINRNTAAVLSVTGSVITTKSAAYEPGSKYVKEIATPPATITAHTNEIISISIEDANGNSQAVVAGTTNSLVDVWKITTATPVADFATGTKIASDIGNGAFRWIGLDGFKLVFNNKDNGVYRYCSMSKGDYTVGWYLYDVPTGGLTQEQSNVLNSLDTKNDAIFDEVNSLMTGFVESTDSLHAIRNAVDAVPANVRTELATELGRIDVAVSTRSTLTPEDIPAGLTAAEVRTELATELGRIDVAVSTRSTLTPEDIPAGLTAAQVRTELATELGRIDVAVSTRSTLTAQDIPEGLTATEVWSATTRTLTEAPGLTTDQAEQLRKVAQLHGVGVDLVVTETTRTAGDVSQTLTTDEAGSTTVSAA